jgi:hypothetical protein
MGVVAEQAFANSNRSVHVSICIRAHRIVVTLTAQLGNGLAQTNITGKNKIPALDMTAILTVVPGFMNIPGIECLLIR